MATAYAGHAGELSGQAMMPHELLGLVAVLTLLVLSLAVLTILTIRRLRRVERRVAALEQRPAGGGPDTASTRQES